MLKTISHWTVNRAIYNAQNSTLNRMGQITANDLKTRGIAAIEASLVDGRTEAVVSVRGADRYVVMEMAQYQHLRECELEAALAESRADIAAGRFVTESAAAHLARVQAMIAAEAPEVEATAKIAPPKRSAGGVKVARRLRR